MFDINISNPLWPARIRDGMDNALSLFKKAWNEKVRWLERVPHESATSVKLFPMPLSSHGGCYPDSLEEGDLLQSALRREHFLLLITPRAQRFRGVLPFS